MLMTPEEVIRKHKRISREVEELEKKLARLEGVMEHSDERLAELGFENEDEAKAELAQWESTLDEMQEELEKELLEWEESYGEG